MKNHSLGYPDASEFERLLSIHIDDERAIEYLTTCYEDIMHELLIAEHKLKQIEMITKEEE